MKTVIFVLTILISIPIQAQIPSILQYQEQDSILTARDLIASSYKQIILSRIASNIYLSKMAQHNGEQDAMEHLVSKNFAKIIRLQQSFLAENNYKQDFDKVVELWDSYQKKLQEPISVNNAKEVFQLNDKLCAALNNFTQDTYKYLQTVFPKPMLKKFEEVNQITNLAFMQGILAQEMMNCAFASKYQLRIRGLEKRMDGIEEQFFQNFARMLDAPFNTAEIDKQLRMLQAELEGAAKQLNQWLSSDKQELDNVIFSIRSISVRIIEIAKEYNEFTTMMTISYALTLSNTVRSKSMEIARLYSLISLEKDLIPAEKELVQNLEEYEQILHLFKLMAPSEELQRSAHELSLFFGNFKNQVSKEFDPLKIFNLIEQCYILMSNCDNTATEMVNFANALPVLQKVRSKYQDDESNYVQLINSSGKLTTNLEQLYIYLILAKNNNNYEISLRRYQDASSAFEQHLEELAESALNSNSIEEELEQLKQQWQQLQLQLTSDQLKGIDIAQIDQIIHKMRSSSTKIPILYAEEMNAFITRTLQNR